MTGAVPKKRLTRTGGGDRKSTRLNSSHQIISYAVFCLKKKKTHLNYSHPVISYSVLALSKKSRVPTIMRHAPQRPPTLPHSHITVLSTIATIRTRTSY